MVLPHNIEGVFDHNLRLRTSLGKGEFGEVKFRTSANIDGAAIFIEFDKCPNVMFNIEELVRHSYDMLLNEGYVDSSGKRTDKEYDRPPFNSTPLQTSEKTEEET